MKKKYLKISLILLICVSFIDIVKAETYNNYYEATRSCGNGWITGIPTNLPKVISILYTIIQVAVPIVLVVFGMLDLFKGLSAQKEDEIKKGQQTFIKRLIAAAIVFLVFIIVKLGVSLAADNEKDTNKIVDCMECFIKNKC